mmetsp:Transcript_87886/g.250539  ORF Transcript_87886/g.250539 Transcript_87886/m.250539 type:complete len:182 (-) Transcript_87886:2553-3098(-)
MALIWSKKSTGMPVEILSAHSTSPKIPPAKISHCILDIDIHKNEPQIEKHDQRVNPEGWRGSEITVTVAGNWTTYKSRVTAYLQQLAVITPYADFKLTFKGADADNKVCLLLSRPFAISPSARTPSVTSWCIIVDALTRCRPSQRKSSTIRPPLTTSSSGSCSSSRTRKTCRPSFSESYRV